MSNNYFTRPTVFDFAEELYNTNTLTYWKKKEMECITTCKNYVFKLTNK